MGRNLAVLAAAFVLLHPLAQAPVRAVEAPRQLKWADLRPVAAPDESKKAKAFFAGSTPLPAGADDSAAPPPLPEGKFMSMKRRQPGSDKPPAVVTALEGQRVSLAGYVVPLDFEATTVKEFLLVPFVGACIHVPPPPANQIVYVKSDKGFDVSGTFDPVTVTGTMKIVTAFTGLADAGYTLEAEAVEERKE